MQSGSSAEKPLMSSELVWNIIKKNSCFLKKQRQGCKVTTFSSDKMNVTNVYSPKCIGLCQKRAVGVNCEGKKIVLAVKSTKNVAKPNKMVHEAKVKSAKAIAKEVVKGSYRPCFEEAAVARYNALDLALRRARRNYVNKKRLMGRAH